MRSRDDIYKLVAYNIKEIRKSKNLTQAQLAQRAGYSHVTIRKIEAKSTKKYFSVEAVFNIALALDVDVGCLFKNRN